MIPDLQPPDLHHLRAAEGWLELGTWTEASEELEKITASQRAHPDVLVLRYHIYATAKKWEAAAEIARAISEIVPESSVGYMQMAYALHELKRTRDAWSVLLPIVDKFPDEPILRYNLACYACQLGNLTEAMQWVAAAIDLAGC